MTDPKELVATPSQTVGPFFHFGLATNEALGRVAAPAAPGERIRLQVQVLDGEGLPVPDALIEIYQADAAGAYPRTPSDSFNGFGRLPTNDAGTCTFETIRPGPVPHDGGVQAPHVNVCLLARGLLRQIYTRIYFQGDAGQDSDPLLSLVPPDRVRTLLATRATDTAAIPGWEFTVRLHGHRRITRAATPAAQYL